MPSISISSKEPAKSPSGLEQFLDRRVLPLPVIFLTNRIVILATLALLIPLIFFSQDQPVVNALNSYLNVMSVVVSSTVLLYATIADVRDRAAAHRREEIAQEYQQVLEQRVQAQERVLEKRVQEEHEINEKILAHAVQNSLQNILVENLEKLRAEDREHAAGLARAYEKVLEQRVQAEHELNEKILQSTIENVLGERLKMVLVEEDAHAQQMHREVMMGLQSYRVELAELAQQVRGLMPGSPGAPADGES